MASLLFTLIYEITIFVQKSDFILWITVEDALELHKLNRNQFLNYKTRRILCPLGDKPRLVHAFLLLI